MSELNYLGLHYRDNAKHGRQPGDYPYGYLVKYNDHFNGVVTASAPDADHPDISRRALEYADRALEGFCDSHFGLQIVGYLGTLTFE